MAKENAAPDAAAKPAPEAESGGKASRVVGALLAANESLRLEKARIWAERERYRTEAQNNKRASAAWMMTAVAADGGVGIYGAVYAVVLNQMPPGKCEATTKACDAGRAWYAQERLSEVQRRAAAAAGESGSGNQESGKGGAA